MILALIILAAFLVCFGFDRVLRLSPWVYKTTYPIAANRRCYAKIGGRPLYRDRPDYRLWSPCYRIVPGLWLCIGKRFYGGEEEFHRLWQHLPGDRL